MKKITQFVVDTFIDDIDGGDYEAGFVDGQPYTVELIDESNVLVKGKKGLYVVENIGTDDEFILKLVERIEVRSYDEDGYDETEIVECDSECRYCAGGR